MTSMVSREADTDEDRSPRDFAPGIERVFASVPEEGAYRIARVEGALPPYLRGTYLLNGPARFQRGDLRYRHWLDGDGMVAALRFDDDGASVVHRYVRSTKWVDEEAAGRALYRTFGTAFEGDRLVRGIALASPVNVSVYPFAGQLLALGEQGLPWALDPETLETRGPFNFGGGLNEVSPFSAHPKIDPETGDLVNFGVSFSATQPCIHLYRFAASGTLVSRHRVPLEHPCSLHDFLLSARHAVFYVSPLRLDMTLLAGGGRTLMEALSWEPERGSRLMVVERESGKAVASIPIGGRYSLHGINSFESSDERGERLVVDVVELDRPVYDQYETLPDLFTDVARGRPVRFVLDLERGEVVERREIAYDLAPDFPAIDPRLFGRAYDDLWMLGIAQTGRAGRKFFDQVVHLRWSDPLGADLWQAPPGVYLGGEPAFAPDPGDDHRGAVICQRYDSRTGEGAFLVFDAHRVAAGPVAVLPLETPIHLGFHAAFYPEP
jgi:all-trans-8'-apo-beta-carotenal 15,15'-oxygenase